MRKNRFPNCLPCKYTLFTMYRDDGSMNFVSADVDRVVLSTDNDQPDYINACFLDVRKNFTVVFV